MEDQNISKFDQIKVKRAYSTAFSNNQAAIINSCINDANLTKLKSAGIISDAFEFSLLEKNVALRASQLYNHLTNTNDVNIYKKFITFCDENEKNVGEFIKDTLREQLNASGLSHCYPSLLTENLSSSAPSQQKAPTNDDNIILALQVIYSEMFEKINHDYIRENIDLSVGSWLNDLRAVIVDKAYLAEIMLATKNEEKGILAVQYLVQKNDITLYKTFIRLWEKHSPAKAKQFETNLNNLIHKRGLREINETFRVESVSDLVPVPILSQPPETTSGVTEMKMRQRHVEEAAQQLNKNVQAANQHAQERANTTHDKWTQNLTFFNISVIISMILLGILVAVLLYKGI